MSLQGFLFSYVGLGYFLTGQKYSRPRRYPTSRNDPLQFDGDFDFESSNAQFNKEDIAKELMNKLKITGKMFLAIVYSLSIYRFFKAVDISYV